MVHFNDEQIAKTLLDNQLIKKKQMDEALKLHRETGKRVTKILSENGYCPTLKLNLELDAMGVTDLDAYIPDTELLEKFKEEQVRKHKVMPIFLSGNKIHVALAEPKNFEAQQMIGFTTGLSSIKNIESSEEDVMNMINKYFGRRGAILEAMKEVQSRGGKMIEERRFTGVMATSADAPIVKLVDEYIQRAMQENASDIHFEPQENSLMVRMRIDGLLHTIENIPPTLTGPVTSRVKIMSGMKIDQRMIPQDGRFSKLVDNIEVDIRVSSFPGIFGESLVLRLLKRRMLVPVSDLGMSKNNLKKFRTAIQSDKGILLVTGPTGCGKTTTLVSILDEIRDPTKKIITLENPVEYQIDNTVQGNIHPQAGFTWAGGLRAILRHDPNIIMVAEIRDKDTVSIAMEAGLTGHFVLSTLHTNNAPSTIIRLLEMGVEPYILGSSLIGVVAQRLVRVICGECRETYMPPLSTLQAVGLTQLPKSMKLYRGKGCKHCRGTGFRGRTGLFEIMMVTDEMRQLILNRAGTTLIQAAAQKSGMRSLREDGIRKALQGITTLEEIMSVTQETKMDT